MIAGNFLALVGPGQGEGLDRLLARSGQLFPQLECIHASPRCLILADGVLPRAFLGEGRGVILGRLHGPDEGACSPGEIRGKTHAFPDWHVVTRDNWGDYIVIDEGNGSGSLHVARSAMGQLPCYHVRDGGMVILSNAARMIEALGIALPIDRQALLHHLLSNVSRKAATCLSGLEELEAGYHLTVNDGDPISLPFWNPWRYAGRDGQIRDMALAPALVRERVIDATRKSARDHAHILLGLSGGLDSSILASSLAAAGIEFSCFTLVTPDGSGDERRYARLVAQHFGRPLHEVEERPGDIDIRRSAASHLPRPVARCFAQSDDRIQRQLARELGADAFMSGGGGDNIFYYVHSIRPDGRNWSPAAGQLFAAPFRRKYFLMGQSDRQSLRCRVGKIGVVHDDHWRFATFSFSLISDYRACDMRDNPSFSHKSECIIAYLRCGIIL